VAAAAGCCASTPLGEKKPNSLVAAAHAVTVAVEAAEGEAAHAARVGTLVRKLAAVAAVQRRSGHADMASAATAVAQLHKNKGGAHVTAAAVLGDQRHALLQLLLSRCGPSLWCCSRRVHCAPPLASRAHSAGAGGASRTEAPAPPLPLPEQLPSPRPRRPALATPLPSNSPHDHMILRVELVGSHRRWKRPCLQTAHMTI
jgi:hypothetical protein